jgi:hypothetical protein
MAELRIRTEFLPERCEICHQADYFDAIRNYCSRCDGTTEILKPHAEDSKSAATTEIIENRYRIARHFIRLFASIWFAMAALIPVIFVMVISFFLFEIDITISDFLLSAVLLPISSAAICGFIFGSAILDRSRVKTSAEAKNRGFNVAVFSYILYNLMLLPTAFLINYSNGIEPTTSNVIGGVALIFFYGSIFVGWLILIVGSYAGWLLHKFFEGD